MTKELWRHEDEDGEIASVHRSPDDSVWGYVEVQRPGKQIQSVYITNEKDAHALYDALGEALGKPSIVETASNGDAARVKAYERGYNAARIKSYREGHEDGHVSGYNSGHRDGYAEGRREAIPKGEMLVDTEDVKSLLINTNCRPERSVVHAEAVERMRGRLPHTPDPDPDAELVEVMAEAIYDRKYDGLSVGWGALPDPHLNEHREMARSALAALRAHGKGGDS